MIKRVLLIVIGLFGLTSMVVWLVMTPYLYRQHQLQFDQQLATLGHLLTDMRVTYRERLQAASLPLSAQVLSLCPGGVYSEIAQRFAADGSQSIRFNNVSDHPRNPNNRADVGALGAIEQFKLDPATPHLFSTVSGEDGGQYRQLALPLWVEQECLRCHGEKEDAPAAVQQLGEGGFGYQLGDLRGVLLVRMPMAEIERLSQANIRESMLLLLLLTLLLGVGLVIGLFYWVVLPIRGLTRASERMAQGGYLEPLPIQGGGAVATLTQSFNRLTCAVMLHEGELQRQRTFLKTVIDGVADPIMVIGPEYHIQMMNRAAAEFHGINELSDAPCYCYQLSHHSSSPCASGAHPCPLRIARDNRRPAKVEHIHVDARGERRIFELEATPLWGEDGAFIGVVESSHDITERIRQMAQLQQSEHRLQHLANHDTLTELPNRLAFEGQLNRALTHADQSHTTVTLLYIDLDGFKYINDSLGHDAGDELLVIIARRIQQCVRNDDFVARLGGDEFVVLLGNLSEYDLVARICQKILKTLAEVIHLQKGEVHLTSSIGLSSYPADSSDAIALLKDADTAMYKAKESGKNRFHLFSQALSEGVSERFEMEQELRHALERGQFELYYQPQIDLRSGQVYGVEALLRWHHPTYGLVSPVRFIPLLEESGLIIPVGAWVISTAMEQVKAWDEDGEQPLRVAVNLSLHQVYNSDIVATVATLLQQSGIDPCNIEIEITESTAMRDVTHFIDTMAALSALGIQIAIDDFGTGYSSLSQLTAFRCSTLKVDRSFISDLEHSEQARSVAHAIITLGHSMSMTVLAEGVENVAQLTWMKQMGADQIQGFFYSRPLPVMELQQWLHQRAGEGADELS